ncbi:GIY-YIG nuclease family protein [Periweissella cryptocerci]|uniref:GIY-YIG nuclease family protein n=1 Tax=Periweissella cryptocerci TaxID=2506420 RepID=A0A4P6YTY7_9LACO|nr:GIY-YIG nuclease family protein [Periweissella cryptocerci]QBO36239.1 GIY-YIG nuclease family protein [Periweissella cryptocerci]
MEELTLDTILHIDELKKKYGTKRVLARFNTDFEYNNTELSFKDMYLSDNPLLNDWMNSTYSEKGKRRQQVNDIVLHFIQIDQDKWLFVDAMQVFVEEGHNISDQDCPDVTWSTDNKPVQEVKGLFNRLIVNKPKTRNWIYKDEKAKNVIVDTILDYSYKESQKKFPGYNQITLKYNELKNVISSNEWKLALSAVYGVYVITDTKTGTLYVGSATGDEGVYGRWDTYLTAGYDKNELDENGKYPNKELQKIVAEDGLPYIRENFRYSLIEIFPKTEIGHRDALERESHWKNVLDTRAHGYNAN